MPWAQKTCVSSIFWWFTFSHFLSGVIRIGKWGAPQYKDQKLENFLNKMSLTGCKWSNLTALGTENPVSYPLFQIFSFPPSRAYGNSASALIFIFQRDIADQMPDELFSVFRITINFKVFWRFWNAFKLRNWFLSSKYKEGKAQSRERPRVKFPGSGLTK